MYVMYVGMYICGCVHMHVCMYLCMYVCGQTDAHATLHLAFWEIHGQKQMARPAELQSAQPLGCPFVVVVSRAKYVSHYKLT